jgi:hypothetical protein
MSLLNKDSGTWVGFLIMAFLVVGLVGAMGIYGAQIPFERALARSATLDEALADASRPDAQARLTALRPLLDDSADHLLSPAGLPLPDFAARVTAERTRMFAAFGQDARDTGRHLRLVLAVFTIMGGTFGVLVLGLVRSSARKAP